MSTPNFSNILSTKMSEIEKPKPLPSGSYSAIITKTEFGETKSDKKTPYLRLFLKPLGAGADVDAQALQEFGPIGDKEMKFDFYLTKDSLHRLKTFLAEVIGVDDVNSTLETGIAQLPMKGVTMVVTHTLNKDEIYANVERLLKAE